MTQTSETTRTTITVPSDTQPRSLKDLHFGQAAQDSVTLPVLKRAFLKWFNGATTDQQTLAIGWHVDAGINPYIDETMQGMGMQRYVVEHRTADADGNTMKPYWHVQPCSLIFVAEGALSTMEMDDSEARTGMAYAREIELDKDKKPVRYPDGQRNIKKHMVLKLRVFIHELVQHGYAKSLPLILNGNIVNSMIEAVAKQGDVLKAYRDYTGEGAPFYGFSLPLAPSKVRKMVGVAPSQSPIYPMLAQVPTTIDEAYLLAHATPDDLVRHIREDLLGETIVWSINESARMLAIGQEASQQPTIAAPSSNGNSRLGTPAADPLVQKPQIDWITTQYCKDDEQAIQKICTYFEVERLDQLKMNQFRELVNAKQKQDSTNVEPQTA